MTLTISWSSLKNHEQCRQQVFLRKAGKMNPAQNVRNYFHGNVVDSVMREWLSSDTPLPGQMVEMVEPTIERLLVEVVENGEGVVRWKKRNDRKDMTAFCRELVTRLEPILYELVVPYDFEPAKRFTTPVSVPYLDGSMTTINLTGEIDLLVRDDERQWHIWDLKGTANDSYWRQTIAQLTFYDLAVHSMFGDYSQRAGLIQPMCSQRVMSVTVQQDQRLDMMSRIIRMAHFMWKGDWQPKESSTGCSYCAVQHACAKFKPVGDAQARKDTLAAMAEIPVTGQS